MSFVSINPEIDPRQSTLPVHRIHGTQVSYRSITASSYSSNSITWNVVPPSMSTYMSRSIQYKIPMQIVFAATTTGTDSVLEPDYDALRNLAGLRMLVNQNIAINGQSIPSQQTYLLADLVAHYKREYRRNHPLSAVDTCAYLTDAVGSSSNPMSDYNDSESFEGGMKRGAFHLTGVTRSTSAATLTFDLVEWLYVPELLGLDKEDELGLIRIRNFEVVLAIDLSSKNIWSHAIGAAKVIDSATVTITSQPTLLAKYTSVPSDMVPQGPLVYNHLRCEVFSTAHGAVSVNGTGIVNSNNIQLSTVPKFAWLFVRESDSNKAWYDSDTFATITNVSINFNNQTALLSSASQDDLHKISKDIGLISSLDQFKGLSQNGFTTIGTIGSLFGCAFGKHISLDGLSVGQGVNLNFSAQVTFKNNNQNGTYGPLSNATLYVILGYDQSLIINDGGLLTIETPLARGVDGEVVMVPYENQFEGGSVGGFNFRNFFSKIVNFLKNTKLISKTADAVAPVLEGITKKDGTPSPFGQVARSVGSVASHLGFGEMSKSQLKKAMSSL
jgi:hypothetical protein